MCIRDRTNRLIPPKKLKKDFKEIKQLIEAHPAPYRHITKERLTALIDSTEQLLHKEMDMVDFFKLVSPIYHELKDGHSAIYLPYKWRQKYKRDNGVFPYKVHLTEEHRLYLITDYSSTTRPACKSNHSTVSCTARCGFELRT